MGLGVPCLSSLPVRREDNLLALALDCHGFHFPVLRRQVDRACIGRIVLVSADECLGYLPARQLDLLPQLLELPRPVLRAAACLHADRTRCVVGKTLQELCTPDRLVEHFAGFLVRGVHLEHVLGDVDSDYRFAMTSSSRIHDEISRRAGKQRCCLLKRFRYHPPSTVHLWELTNVAGARSGHFIRCTSSS